MSITVKSLVFLAWVCLLDFAKFQYAKAFQVESTRVVVHRLITTSSGFSTINNAVQKTPRRIHTRMLYSPYLATRPEAKMKVWNPSTSHLLLTGAGGDADDPLNDENIQSSGILDSAGIVALPVVWISLYFVATTGGGLPSGPFGILGALEGISYLLVVGFAGLSIYQKLTFDPQNQVPNSKQKMTPTRKYKDTTLIVATLSLVTIVAGLFVLLKLIVDQGCVPNAKPLLDYSDYLPVCDPEKTPGLFGGL